MFVVLCTFFVLRKGVFTRREEVYKIVWGSPHSTEKDDLSLNEMNDVNVEHMVR